MRPSPLHAAWMTLLACGLLATGAAIAQDGGRRDRGQSAGGADARLRPPGGRDEWQLGASVDSLDTGARVRQINRNSPAERAGLEVGDIIITVGGYQVGRVGGQTYTLEAELQRQADSNGRVRLLVQDKRSNRLTNVSAQLERGRQESETVIRGRAIVPDNARLPRDAQIHVRLVRKAILGERIVVETTEPTRGASPVEFALRVDSGRVESDKEYELEVEITSQGRAIYVANGRYPVRFDRPPQRVDVRLRKS